MNKGLITIVGAAALVASTAGFAGGPDVGAANNNNNAAGFYINGNVGYGHNSVRIDNTEDNGISNVHHNSFAWAANIGYQFNPYVAVEAGYMQLPYARLTVTAPGTTISVKEKFKMDAITMDVKGIYPVSEQFDVFAKAGLAYESQRVTAPGVVLHLDKHPLAPLFGLGVDYNITQNVAVSVQGVTILKESNDFPATYTGLVGLTYKFS